jgi:hypothetical protein
MHPTQLGNLQFFYLAYSTRLMCFGIAGYNRVSAVKKTLRQNFAHTVAETPYCSLSSQCPAFPTLLSHTSTHSLSFIPLSLYSLSEQSYRAGRVSISEISISQSYTSLKAITETDSLF